MNAMDLVTLVIAALAVARLTRLVTTDRITEAPRNWVLRRLPTESLWAYLLVCGWCMSIYMAAVVVALLVWGPAWVTWVLAGLAFSYVAGWLASKESE